uniref:Uncharacterized protein n=1 Tax=Rhizophora mucronata TaxID=61149 RepID=A0A2P2QVH1_RHIMU
MEMHHRICTWHVYQHAPKRPNRMLVCMDLFMNDLSSCFSIMRGMGILLMHGMQC